MSADSSPQSVRDIGFYVVVLMVAATAIWLLLIPLVPSVAMANMKRFHLRNDSFAAWAMHFPLPSMYNFANTYKVDNVPADLMMDPLFETEPDRYINHFPLRLLTFGDARHGYLRSGDHKWVTVTSRYQGQVLTTKVHANRVEGLTTNGPATNEPGQALEYEFKRISGNESTP